MSEILKQFQEKMNDLREKGEAWDRDDTKWDAYTSAQSETVEFVEDNREEIESALQAISDLRRLFVDGCNVRITLKGESYYVDVDCELKPNIHAVEIHGTVESALRRAAEIAELNS